MKVIKVPTLTASLVMYFITFGFMAYFSSFEVPSFPLVLISTMLNFASMIFVAIHVLNIVKYYFDRWFNNYRR